MTQENQGGIGKCITCIPLNEYPLTGRQVYSHDEYIRLVMRSDSLVSHDYSSQSVEENPQMMAFFDSLVQVF